MAHLHVLRIYCLRSTTVEKQFASVASEKRSLKRTPPFRINLLSLRRVDAESLEGAREVHWSLFLRVRDLSNGHVDSVPRFSRDDGGQTLRRSRCPLFIDPAQQVVVPAHTSKQSSHTLLQRNHVHLLLHFAIQK